jgi:hypothetical protein
VEEDYREASHWVGARAHRYAAAWAAVPVPAMGCKASLRVCLDGLAGGSFALFALVQLVVVAVEVAGFLPEPPGSLVLY